MIVFSFVYGSIEINARQVRDRDAILTYQVTYVEFHDDSVEFERLLRPMKKKFGCAGKLSYAGIWLQGNQTANLLRFLVTDFELFDH